MGERRPSVLQSWLIRGLAALSLLICLSFGVVWAASYFVGIYAYREDGRDLHPGVLYQSWSICIGRGGIEAGYERGTMTWDSWSEKDNHWTLEHSNKPAYAEWITSDRYVGFGGADHNPLGFRWDDYVQTGETGTLHEWNWVFPCWIPVLAFGTGPFVWMLRRYRRMRRRWRGQCAVCGYDLRGSPGRCPECGTAPAERGWPPTGKTGRVR